MSQEDAQKALGRPGESSGGYDGPESLLGSGKINTPPHSEVERWGTDAEKDDFNKQAELRAQAKKENPELGDGGGGKKGFGGKVKNLLIKRQRTIIIAALGSSLIGLIIAGFFALLPLKLESFMKNFEQKFGQKVEDVTERRVGQIVTYYLVKRALGYEFANCDSAGSRGTLCDPIVNRGGIIADTYRNMQIKKFENTLAEKQNIRFRVYDRGDGVRRLAITTPGGNLDDTIDGFDGAAGRGRFDPDRDVFATNKEARLAFKNAVKKEVPWYGVMKRRHMRALLRDKYGVKQWRIFEKQRERADDRVDAAKKRLRTVLIDNVTRPALGNMGLYLKCVIDGCTKAELNGDANPTKVEEANAAANDADCSSGSATRSAACRGGLDPDSNGTEQDSREREAARQEGREGLNNVGDGADIPDDLSDNPSSDEVQKIVQRSVVRKIASIGITGVGIAEIISQIDKAISEDYITDITESRNKLQFVRAFQIYQTGADEWKKGGMSGEEVNAIMSQLNGAESSRLYAHDFDLTIPGNEKLCGDGKVLPPGELVCEDKMIRPKPVSDLTAYYNSSPALKVMHAVAVAYRATVGKIFSVIGDVLNTVAGPLFEAAMSAVPGVAKEKVQDLLNWVMNKFFGIAVTGVEVGSDLYEIIRGGAKSYYNDVAFFTTGGTTLSPEEVALVEREIEIDKDLENSSFAAKVANLDYNKSIASRLLAAMPSSFDQATGKTMSAALNPGGWVQGLRLSMPSSAAAQTNDPQGIVEKGWPTDPAVRKFLYLSPDHGFWTQCDEFDEEWSRQIAEDPDRKTSVRAEYRDKANRVVVEVVEGVNPCRLNHVAIESLKAPFTDEDDGGLGDGTSICRPEEAGDGDNSSINPVLVIGDSIVKGADEAGGLKRLIGGEVIVDASTGRQITSGGTDGNRLSGMETVKQSDQVLNAKTIIIALGTNPESGLSVRDLKQDMAQMINEVKRRNRQAKIYIVGIVSTSSSQYGARNTALQEVASAEEAGFINVRESEIPLSGDDIHPTAAGYKKLARKISNDLPDSTQQTFTVSDDTADEEQPQAARRDDHFNLADIAATSGAQSISIRRVGSNTTTAFKGAEASDVAATMLKITLVDAIVKQQTDLNREIAVTSDIPYSGSSSDGLSVGDRVKVSDAIYRVAAYSSNTHANILIKALGGPSAATQKLNAAGYKKTKVQSYYKETATGNQSSSDDITRAVGRMYSGDNEGHKIALRGLKNTNVDYGLDSEANSWGKRSVSPVATANSGVFKSGGSKYIITVYVSRSNADAVIQQATNAVLEKLKDNREVKANSVSGCGDEGEKAKDSSEITGSRSELNERLLGNSKIKIDGRGVGDVNSGRANDNLVKLMISIMENGNFELPISVIQTGHGCPSQHCDGLAVDIAYYSNNKTGQRLYKFLFKNRKELKIDQMIFDLPPSGYQCLDGGNPVDCRGFYKEDLAGHNNHIHVSVKR